MRAPPFVDPAAASANRARYEPKVQSYAWVTEHEQSFDAFMQALTARCDLSPAACERMLWHGGLHIAKRRIVVDDVPARVEAGVRAIAYWFEREPEPMPLAEDAVLLEGEGLVAVHKPSWLPSQPTRASIRFCLEALVRERCAIPRLFAAHRLDRGTSGVVLLSHTSEAARGIYRQFFARTVDKRYCALVMPPPREDRFEVTGYLAPTPHPAHACFAFSHEPTPGGRESHTSFTVLARNEHWAKVEAVPHTGRTHQIRVHLAAAGSPIVGDDLYGSVPAARLHLHASSLSFRMPVSGRAVVVEAPVPF